MAPKKDKNKDEAGKKDGGGGFTEVEKTFLELQIAECNRKIARLRSAVDEYEQRNEELQKAYDKLDEDRADIISYLKKTLLTKTEENAELKEKVKGLEETREIENAEFKKTVNELERNFTIMKDQLTSENKLLAGKLNTLEEFRAIREDLMKKYEKQEQDFKDQEMKYKRMIYDAEKKFIIGKDKLKKEMEARLLQLAQDFQDATELRIAASTHRVIRENIAINNELDSILSTQAKLSLQNENYKESERAAKIAKEVAEEERDKAINKNVVQLKVIEQLTNAFQDIKKEKALYEKRNYDFDTLQIKNQILTKENENLSLQVRILEQNMHARMSDQNKIVIESNKVAKECAKFKKILKEAAIAVQAALKMDQWATSDPSREIMDKQLLLSRLLDIISQYRDVQRAESIDTLVSFGKIYEEGDLGFVPKPLPKKSVLSTAITISSKEVFEVEKRSTASSTFSVESHASIKTIPSVPLIPKSSEPEIGPQDSVASFITSTQSSASSTEAEDSYEGLTDMEKKLEQSKLEIQKSMMKDLVLSQAGFQSTMRIDDHKIKMAKSVIFEEIPGGSVEVDHVEIGQIKDLVQDDSKPEELEENDRQKKNETKHEEIKQEETKQEDIKQEDTKQEETKQE